ncbi:hypothetical protein Scep_002081 [Stephania cephalantha]|uniref:RNase H type-1 domain-containing protein n=1 Tax=Stephania cephalantha TaxID=152367 RepID=A0AAP0LC06_9MAGN
MGVVLRNENGGFLSAMGGKQDGVLDSRIAEVVGVREALSWLKRKEVEEVTIKLNGMVVVQAISNKGRDNSYIWSIIGDCTALVINIKSYCFSFVINKLSYSHYGERG